MKAMVDYLSTKQLQEYQKGKYPHFDKPILNWLEFRIENYLKYNTERI